MSHNNVDGALTNGGGCCTPKLKPNLLWDSLAIADAEAAVSIHACPVEGGDCTMAEPGAVKLSKRVQELSAKLGGVIKDCAIAVDLDTGEGTFDVSEDCVVNDEEIALMLSTTASHHFNFVLPNMDQGVYEIKAICEFLFCKQSADS